MNSGIEWLRSLDDFLVDTLPDFFHFFFQLIEFKSADVGVHCPWCYLTGAVRRPRLHHLNHLILKLLKLLRKHFTHRIELLSVYVLAFGKANLIIN